jgi:membrane associated rhomboid family serine protease
MIAPVTLTLIIVNVAVYFWTNFSKEYFDKFSERPYEIVRYNRYYQMLTSAFLHANLMHLFFNMFTLFSFGTVLESLFKQLSGEIPGSIYFLLIYFISLFSGSILTTALHFKNPGYVAVGASGAVSGVIFSYVLFFPMSKVGVFFVPMPAFIFAVLYVAVSIYGMKKSLGNIGHEAHLGGALGGLIATLLMFQEARMVLMHYL